MTSINGSTITTTRGDTTEFEINLRDSKGHSISVTTNTVKFSVKSSYADTQYIINPKTLTSNTVSISAQEMKLITPGRYVYDIEVTLSESGVVSTAQRGTFIVLPDVTI